MNILLLAPQPFYQERGTPIAIRLLLQALSARGDRVDVLTYHEGQDISLPGVNIQRIPRLPGLSNIRPGFSFKKLICDILLGVRAWRMCRRQTYDLIHAVEEAAFIALLINKKMRIPYVYDMDSCLSQQMLDKHFLFRLWAPWLQRLEGLITRRALAVVPVCEALAAIARAHRASNVWLLPDVPLTASASTTAPLAAENLRLAGTRFMYVGNLESYQGIDLLLRSFACLHRERNNATLAIIGGTPPDIARYQALATRLGVDQYVRFTGPRPVAMLTSLLHQADVLVSPRIQGLNTPMKIYSYLQSGVPILATDLPTHTQVLNSTVAMLAPAKPPEFAAAMRQLADNPELRKTLARQAAELAAQKHSWPVFEQTVRRLYEWLATQVNP
ncbi:MAG: glycosyltransferase family 4 protein [Lentisphaerae bacterium]|nr:glycosyltransferase family 4 protein [Lentisphaerota bacterium]